jgi:hypothetical protein
LHKQQPTKTAGQEMARAAEPLKMTTETDHVMADAEVVSVRMSADEVARLDELRGADMSRSGFVRELVRLAGPLDEAPTYDEAVVLLARSARAGKVAAQVALERALRSDEPEPSEDSELERLIRGG